ncbi:MAG: magnesium transporter [Nanoarchaeota archaeon]|nr:magnesium transporter [Nanoarchaeota archaeon]MBU1134993.1 magnesium transporter [Nanoarchaeota archaeon]MBU2520078.1 magnesium transporter [Nanoarchaeota archaeon]
MSKKNQAKSSSVKKVTVKNITKTANNRPHTYMENIPKTFVELQKKEKELKKMNITKKQMKKEEDKMAYGIHHKYLSLKRKPFYTKEYDNPKTNVSRVIINESLKILILVALIGSFGGIFLESIKGNFISILPLIIILPSLNGMIGNHSAVFSSRFSTMLHKGILMHKWWSDPRVKKLILQIFILSLVSATIISFSSLLISALMGFALNSSIVIKIFTICIIDTVIIILIVSLISIIIGIKVHKKHEDPDNFLIPITTTVADFSNIMILFLLILLLF